MIRLVEIWRQILRGAVVYASIVGAVAQTAASPTSNTVQPASPGEIHFEEIAQQAGLTALNVSGVADAKAELFKLEKSCDMYVLK